MLKLNEGYSQRPIILQLFLKQNITSILMQRKIKEKKITRRLLIEEN